MDVIFDAAKDAANLAKHGVPLALAVKLEWDELIAVPDMRRNYGEKRMVGYAPIGPRVYNLSGDGNICPVNFLLKCAQLREG
jgi:uncharacterized DUF497 family protein